jgi:tripartite-type tricarboxylate transporter receptor subunit TctC
LSLIKSLEGSIVRRWIAAGWFFTGSTVAAIALSQPLPSPPAAKAGAYPTRPIRMLIPFPPAGTADTLARGIGQKLSEYYGHALIMDNRAGAGGNLATDVAAKSKPDGYTLVIATPGPFAANVTLQAGKLPFDPLKDFEPISLLARSPLILITHPSIPVRNIRELLRLAKSRPGELNYATPGNGTSNHMVMETFNTLAGIRIAHIPFKGTAQSLVALLGGEIELLMGQIPSTRAQITAGRVRALALSGTRRSRVLPEVPTFGEAGVAGVEATSWYGIAAPAGTPAEIVRRLAADIARAVASPDLNGKYMAEGVEPETNSPTEYAAFIRAEVTRWGQAVKNAGITAN